ncbi:MAG: hydrogenase iron-sulfur subunit [Isosphaeraceae bacterium]
MANDKDKDKDDNLTVYVAVYDSTDAALADLKDIESLHKEDLVGTYDAAVVDRKHGKPHIVKRMDNPSIRIIRVPCSGRIDPLFILASLQKGADGVLVSGCHPGECHYLTGNYSARRKFALLKSLLGYVGLEEDRVQFSWVSASEGARFARVVEQVTARITALGPAKQLVKNVPGGSFDVAAHP